MTTEATRAIPASGRVFRGYRCSIASFRHAGRRIAYTEHGSGPRTVVLIHGLLLSQRMHEPLARALATRGHRVLTIDLLGHGRSDRPLEPALYSTSIFAEQVMALLDHLDIEEAAILGTSLGANTALEVGHLAPARVRGMVIEMPVLDHALIACLITFGPLMIGEIAGFLDECWEPARRSGRRRRSAAAS